MGINTATLGPLLSTAGTLSSIYGARTAAKGDVAAGAAAAQADVYNAGVAGANADIAAQNEAWAAQAGNVDVGIQQMKNRADAGALKVNQAASGVDINSGSAVNVRASQAATGMLDALTIRSNAAKAAYGYETEVASDKAQAELYKKQAVYDVTAGNQKAKATILAGEASAASGFGNYMLQNSLVGGTAPAAGGDSTYSDNAGWIDWNK